MSQPGISNQPALLVGTQPRAEADSLVRLYTPGFGALTLVARSLRKPGSKLAGQLKPADELLVSAAAGRAGGRILTSVSSQRDHRIWQQDLNLLALYWFMLECSWLASADDASNADGFRLLVNLLRSVDEPGQRNSLAAVFCIRVLALHGMLPDLHHDEDSDEPLAGDALCRASFNGLVDSARAASAGIPPYGLLRISQARLQRWRRWMSRPLLEYPGQEADIVDVSLLVGFTRNHVAESAGTAVRSAEFLQRQWKLSRLQDLAGS